MEKKSQVKHDMLNMFMSLFAQVELLKRSHPEAMDALDTLGKKIKHLHEQFEKYINAEEE